MSYFEKVIKEMFELFWNDDQVFNNLNRLFSHVSEMIFCMRFHRQINVSYGDFYTPDLEGSPWYELSKQQIYRGK